MIRKILSLILFSGISIIYPQSIAKFEIELPEETNGLHIPVSVSIDDIAFLPDTAMILFEIENEKK